MDWKRIAKEDLRELPYLEHCIESHREQLAALEADYVSIKANVTSGSPVQGGASRMEDDCNPPAPYGAGRQSSRALRSLKNFNPPDPCGAGQSAN